MKVYTLNKKFTALSRAACGSRNTAVSNGCCSILQVSRLPPTPTWGKQPPVELIQKIRLCLRVKCLPLRLWVQRSRAPQVPLPSLHLAFIPPARSLPIPFSTVLAPLSPYVWAQCRNEGDLKNYNDSYCESVYLDYQAEQPLSNYV